MTTKKGLGRGLDALIPAGSEPEGRVASSPSAPGAGGVLECRIEDISVGRLQPRQRIAEDKVRELAESIRSQGLLQPLVVRPRKKGGYELIAGERRLRASKLLGLERVPVVVREVDDRGALELALVENLQREDLDPIEEAMAYRRLLTEFEYTQEQLSVRVGKDRTTIANLLRLLSLPEDILDDVKDGRLSAGHARALLSAGAESVMRRIRDAVVRDGISVREAERLAAGERRKRTSKGGKADRKSETEVHVREMEQQLIRALGTKVKIIRASKGGQINVTYFSEEELDRLYRRFLG